MSSFFRELKERKVYRIALDCAVIAWLVIQIPYHGPSISPLTAGLLRLDPDFDQLRVTPRLADLSKDKQP
jgi:hypothetical protein